jgi:hypothetical protein
MLRACFVHRAEPVRQELPAAVAQLPATRHQARGYTDDEDRVIWSLYSSIGTGD